MLSSINLVELVKAKIILLNFLKSDYDITYHDL